MLARLGQVLYLAAVIAVPLFGPATAAEKQPRITGFYSDMRRSKETDDLDGTEIFIFGRYQGYTALYQFWEGGSSPPVAVPVTVSGNRISFDVPAPGGECGHYEGTISDRGFDGFCTVPHPTGHDPNRGEVHLPCKSKSFWQ